MSIKRLFIYATSLLVMISFSECKSKKNAATHSNIVQSNTDPSATPQDKPNVMEESQALPPVIIYKTVEDYNSLVPVILNDEKTKIVSYPSIKDIKMSGKPTELINGYLLDNRGISKNVAFLKYTYEEYAELPKTPNSDELFKMILSNDPLLEIYDCGKRNSFKDLIPELNQKINEAGSDLNKIFKPLK